MLLRYLRVCRRAFAPVKMSFPVHKTDAEWKSALTPEEYNVIRCKGTEPPGPTSEYNAFAPKSGYFVCRACQNPLYSAEAKFHSGCGWPAFDRCYTGSVITQADPSLGRLRTEILCARCGGHLGHVFHGERLAETDERHCVNSLSIQYKDGSCDQDQAPLLQK